MIQMIQRKSIRFGLSIGTFSLQGWNLHVRKLLISIDCQLSGLKSGSLNVSTDNLISMKNEPSEAEQKDSKNTIFWSPQNSPHMGSIRRYLEATQMIQIKLAN
jgi:hypothetical protein